MKEFEEYVERYAKCYHISVEEAKQHAIVKEVEKHYENKEKKEYVWW